MSIAILEINDCGLRCANQQGDLHISPGYALLTGEGITTGTKALEKAYLQPQQSFNQYWRQLNLSPLPSPTPQARHHADLAYAQLLELHRESGSPEEIIFATPGSFDREQLSLVLGLAKAAPFKTRGLVDAAVAAASQATTEHHGHWLHLDVQLHQMVLTRLATSDDQTRPQVERLKVDVVTNIGLKTFYDHWARYIADQFIQQYRYDPLHTADGEQQLYNLLPNWLAQINGDQEVAIALDSPQGSYHLSLNRNDLLGSSHGKLAQLQQKLDHILQPGDTLLASHRVGLLPGLTEQLQPLTQLNDNATIMGCLNNIEAITSSDDSIHFVTRLPTPPIPAKGHNTHSDQGTRDAEIANLDNENRKTEHQVLPETHQQHGEPTPAPQNKVLPTHVLYQHRAQAIGDQLYIHRQADQPGSPISFSSDQESDTLLVRHGGELFLQSSDDDISQKYSGQPLQVGDSFKIGSATLQLIEVS